MHSVFRTLWLASVLLVAAFPAQAQITVAQSATQDITAHGVCLTVTNTCDGDIMIPNASSAEFYGVPAAFGNNYCVTADFCGNGSNSERGFSASYTSYGLRADKVAMSWGAGSGGTLGNGTTTVTQTTPVVVSGGYSWYKLGTSCGIRTDGVAMCWGARAFGRLGDGTSSGTQTTPVAVSGGYAWTSITSGTFTTCGIRTDGVAMCWGGGGSGQLGNGTTTATQTSPVVVSGGYTWRKIDGSSSSFCGIRTDGVAMCWGSGGSGQLGNGTTTSPQTSPVVVSGGYTWRQISAGSGHACGIRTDGVAMCWGSDGGGAGKLGSGTTSAIQTAPVAVSGGYTWRVISARYNHSCGVRTDGVAMCWGMGSNGQLGNGTTTAAQSTPSTVSGGFLWVVVSGGALHSCGIRADGVAMCWGRGNNGEFGNGTTTMTQTTPVVVSGGYTW